MKVRAKSVKEEREVQPFDYDKGFQAKLVRVLYEDVDFTVTAGVHLDPNHFQSKIHRWIAQKILSYAKKHGHGVSRSALRNEMKRDLSVGRLRREDKEAVAATISKLNKPIQDKSYVKDELFRFIKHQAQKNAIVNSIDHLEKHDFEAVEEEFSRVLDVQDAVNGGLGTFYVRDVKERTKKRKKYVKDGISTGTRCDDYLKPGGISRKSLAVVVAPSGKGKSHNLVNLGAAAIVENGCKVLHITLELSADAVLERYDARFSNIPIQNLENKPVAVKRTVKELGKQFGEFLVVKEFPDATLTVPALRAYIKQLERVAFYPDVIIVDYADCMVPTQRFRDADGYEEMGAIYRELRKLAFELNVVVWTASQTNKTALNKEHFDWNDIADSSKKVMIADFVVCFLQTLDEKKRKEARWWVAKSRLGPDKFEISIRVDWSRSLIKDK